MEKDNVKTAITALFQRLMSAEETDTFAKYGDVIELLANSRIALKDMEDYDVVINYSIDNILEQVIKKLNPEVDNNKVDNLYFLYKHYGFMDSNLSSLVKQKEGSGCSVDKSRWVIQCFRDYLLNGNLPDMTIEDKCYWKPRFGSAQQWMDLCSGLVRLYYGNPTLYISSIKELLMQDPSM